jgi:hypothetical protein
MPASAAMVHTGAKTKLLIKKYEELDGQHRLSGWTSVAA